MLEIAASSIVHAECLEFLQQCQNQFNLIYIDPPFNTGVVQRRTRIKTTSTETGDRVGFGGRSYTSRAVESPTYEDQFEDFISWIEPRLREAYRLLSPSGSMFVHLDYREIHYVKVLMDSIFGRSSFINEIIWSYDYGSKPKNRWPAKHDTLLWYVKNPKDYTFNHGAIDRIPYMAPGLVTPEKRAKGKVPTDVWWQTIVPTNGKEKTGYPTQKPLKLLERVIKVHSNPSDWVLDFFSGSGTTAEAAAKHGRNFVAVDQSPSAIDIMQKRLIAYGPEFIKLS